MTKSIFCTVCAVLSSLALLLFGELTFPFVILLILIVIDYIMGLLIAGVFKKSCKTENGGLSSAIGFKGIVKKCCILICVIVANLLDGLLNTEYIRNVVIIGFATNEVISIIENMGLIGIKLPHVIYEAIEILKGDKQHD